MRALTRIGVVQIQQHHIHLPASLCSTLVTRFSAPMEALSPARLSHARRGIPDFATRASDRSVLKHQVMSRHRFLTFAQRTALRKGPFPVCALPRLDFAFGWEARHFTRPNQVSLVRTGRSPSVAPHLALRPRSYGWLLSMNASPERTFTLLLVCASGRTIRLRHLLPPGEGQQT